LIAGRSSSTTTLEVNVLKGKQLTNMRASGKDEAVKLPPIRRMSLEEALSYIQNDELVEVTPKTIRLRKRFLNPHDRKKAARAASDA
jgi:GTP-binding protein